MAENTSCRIYIAGVEQLFADCDREGIVHPNARLETKPWGSRELAFSIRMAISSPLPSAAAPDTALSGHEHATAHAPKRHCPGVARRLGEQHVRGNARLKCLAGQKPTLSSRCFCCRPIPYRARTT
jgi:hypothetical protein